jgi:DNA repair exonuclease SbcCD ATPase subunit
MKIRFLLLNLTLIGNEKNYCVKFKDGLNYISGPTSTGKTSILEMIDYAFGSKGHKNYIEIGNSCSGVELEFKIGTMQYKIKRKLFDFKAPVIVEEWNEEQKVYKFLNRLEIDSPSNKNSLSAFLVEKLGIPDIKISNQAFSFRDLFKFSYLKQTEIDNENILDEKDWVKNNKRKATFEIIFNIYDEMLAELKASAKIKGDELNNLYIRLSGVKDFLINTDIIDIQQYQELKKKIEMEISKQCKTLTEIKVDKGINTDLSLNLQNKIVKVKNELEHVGANKNDQKQYISKLRLLFNQYQSEIEKKEMALEGYCVLNKYEYVVCPNCLKPIIKPDSVECCCLCGNEKGEEINELLVVKKEIRTLKIKITELLKFIDKEEIKLDDILKKENALKIELTEIELEMQLLYKDYVNPHIEQIELLNYEIGRNNRLLMELEQNLKMLDELDRLGQLIKSKEESIINLKDNIKAIEANATDQNEAIKELSHRFYDILIDFKFPKLSAAYIDGRNYLPYVRERLYRDLGSLAGVSLITMAYYLAILLSSCGKMYNNHLDILIIDSPRKNLGAKADQNEFKDEEIFNSIIKFFINLEETVKDKIQLIVVNNGYPDFLPVNCIITEFDGDGTKGLPYGLIDDAL